MTSSKPLEGVELIDCARANVKQGIPVAARQCGYGEDVELFEKNLTSACQSIGVDLQQFSDLITDQQLAREKGGVEIAPDTKSEL